jgi:hypothetical protein
VLTAAEIAARHGVTRRTARRWLARLEAKYGAAVVGRRGAKLFTTDEAMRAVGPPASEEEAPDKRIDELFERLRDHERRTDAIARELGYLRRDFLDFVEASRKKRRA